MTTLTIEIPEKSEKTLAELVEQLGGKVVTNAGKLQKKSSKLTKKEQEFLKGFDKAIEFVNKHQEGMVKAKRIDHLLNEL